MIGNITITKDEYFSLKVDSEILRRLYNGGVDNQNFYGDEDLNTFEKSLIKEIEKL